MQQNATDEFIPGKQKNKNKPKNSLLKVTCIYVAFCILKDFIKRTKHKLVQQTVT